MKIIFNVFLMCLLLMTASRCNYFENKRKCVTVKNGHFFIKGAPDKPISSYSVYREDSIQKEIDLDTKDTNFYSIKWTEPCEYEIRLVRSVAAISDSAKKMRSTNPIIVKIIDVRDSYYIYSAHRNGFSGITDTMWVETGKN